MRLLSINSTLTSKSQLAIDTDPPITEEVVAVMSERKSSESSITFESDSGALIIGGVLLGSVGKEFFAEIEDAVIYANRTVEEEKTRADNARKAMLERLSQVSGLPLS